MINCKFIIDSVPSLVKAIPVTIFMALTSAAVGWVIGFFIALIRKSKVPVLSQVCAVFISFMRGVPMIILLYISYYALPILLYNYAAKRGINLDVTVIPAAFYAIIALTMDQAAYSSEIFRSALAAVDEGQLEAAYSIGMTKAQAMYRVVFPQALPIALPNLGGLFSGLVKGTSLAFYVGVYEITATANLLAMPALNFIEAYIMTTIIYEVVSIITNYSFNRFEFKLKKFRVYETA